MGVELTKKGLRAVANLMPEQGTYLQRVDRIAAALGYRNNATLMSEINKEKTPSPSQQILKRPYALKAGMSRGTQSQSYGNSALTVFPARSNLFILNSTRMRVRTPYSRMTGLRCS